MKRLASVFVIAAFALGVPGCSDDDPTSSPPTTDASTTSSTDATTTTGARPVVSAGDKYVALGTSIASGFGIPVQSTSCGRSDRSYPQLIAAQYELALTDVSCGAATIANVVDTPQGDNPPQITALTPDTELVTVSAGGNDILYNATALGCGDPQTECTGPADLDARFTAATAALKDMLEQIEAAAPEATIVFVTNPREIPEGNCPELSMSDAETAVVRDMGERLEAMYVDVVGETDVLLVDPYVEPGDHTGCAPESERWTAGYDAPDSFAYHPTALGHEVMAEMISEALGT